MNATKTYPRDSAPSKLPVSAPLLAASLALFSATGCGPAAGAAGATVMVGPAPTTTPTTAETAAPRNPNFACEGARIEVGKHTYCAVTTPRSWESARRVCKASGGDLASFNAPEEAHDFFVAVGPKIGAAEAVWFGLSEPKPGAWTWLDGTPLSDSSWNRGEPNNDGGHEDCAEWRLTNGTWNDAPCDSLRPYVCGAPPAKDSATPMKCSGQRVSTAEGEYCFHLKHRKNWSQAKAACESEGTALAVLPTKARNSLIAAAVGPQIKAPSLWIGLTDTNDYSTWVWVTGETPRDLRWRYGEPNNYQWNEQCAEWFTAEAALNDLDCTQKRPFLCEDAPPGADKVTPDRDYPE